LNKKGLFLELLSITIQEEEGSFGMGRGVRKGKIQKKSSNNCLGKKCHN